MTIDTQQAESLTKVVNAAIAQSGDAYDLALILLAASAGVASHASDFDARVYAGSLRLAAASLDGERA